MAAISVYLELAQKVYERQGADTTVVAAGWSCTRMKWGTRLGTGFQGGIFQNGDEVIVAFAGTKGSCNPFSDRSAPWTDIVSDIKIGVGQVPTAAHEAADFVRAAKEIANGRPVSLVGHSLGGGVAQVVGNWTNCPFISFNGPGMSTNLKASAFNIFNISTMMRSAFSRATADTIGMGIRIRGDFTGNFGTQVGWDLVLDMPRSAGSDTHSLDTLETALRLARKLDKAPREIYSIWPRN
jgi:hypothetical protein